MLTDGVTYEITAELQPEDRAAFDDWLPDVVLDWSTQPEVETFEVHRGADAEGQQVRLAFTFANAADWEQFVERTPHRERLARLEEIVDHVRTALWQRAAVSLAGDDTAIVSLEADLTDRLEDGADGQAARPGRPEP